MKRNTEWKPQACNNKSFYFLRVRNTSFNGRRWRRGQTTTSKKQITAKVKLHANTHQVVYGTLSQHLLCGFSWSWNGQNKTNKKDSDRSRTRWWFIIKSSFIPPISTHHRKQILHSLTLLFNIKWMLHIDTHTHTHTHTNLPCMSVQ